MPTLEQQPVTAPDSSEQPPQTLCDPSTQQTVSDAQSGSPDGPCVSESAGAKKLTASNADVVTSSADSQTSTDCKPGVSLAENDQIVEASGGASEEMPPPRDPKQIDEGLKMLSEGKRHLSCKQLPEAAKSLSGACEILAEQCGQLGDECAEAYLYYGKTLLELARLERGVVGVALTGSEKALGMGAADGVSTTGEPATASSALEEGEEDHSTAEANDVTTNGAAVESTSQVNGVQVSSGDDVTTEEEVVKEAEHSESDKAVADDKIGDTENLTETEKKEIHHLVEKALEENAAELDLFVAISKMTGSTSSKAAPASGSVDSSKDALDVVPSKEDAAAMDAADVIVLASGADSSTPTVDAAASMTVEAEETVPKSCEEAPIGMETEDSNIPAAEVDISSGPVADDATMDVAGEPDATPKPEEVVVVEADSLETVVMAESSAVDTGDNGDDVSSTAVASAEECKMDEAVVPIAAAVEPEEVVLPDMERSTDDVPAVSNVTDSQQEQAACVTSMEDELPLISISEEPKEVEPVADESEVKPVKPESSISNATNAPASEIAEEKAVIDDALPSATENEQSGGAQKVLVEQSGIAPAPSEKANVDEPMEAQSAADDVEVVSSGPSIVQPKPMADEPTNVEDELKAAPGEPEIMDDKVLDSKTGDDKPGCEELVVDKPDSQPTGSDATSNQDAEEVEAVAVATSDPVKDAVIIQSESRLPKDDLSEPQLAKGLADDAADPVDIADEKADNRCEDGIHCGTDDEEEGDDKAPADPAPSSSNAGTDLTAVAPDTADGASTTASEDAIMEVEPAKEQPLVTTGELEEVAKGDAVESASKQGEEETTDDGPVSLPVTTSADADGSGTAAGDANGDVESIDEVQAVVPNKEEEVLVKPSDAKAEPEQSEVQMDDGNVELAGPATVVDPEASDAGIADASVEDKPADELSVESKDVECVVVTSSDVEAQPSQSEEQMTVDADKKEPTIPTEPLPVELAAPDDDSTTTGDVVMNGAAESSAEATVEGSSAPTAMEPAGSTMEDPTLPDDKDNAEDSIGDSTKPTEDDAIAADSSVRDGAPEEEEASEATSKATGDVENDAEVDDEGIEDGGDVDMDDGDDDDDVDDTDDIRETADEDEEGDGEGEDDADEVSNLQLAWEMLDLARVIYERKNDKLKVAESRTLLAQVSMENETFPQALEDLQICLQLQKESLPDDSRLIAETFYHMGTVYRTSCAYTEAGECYEECLTILEKRLAKAEAESLVEEVDELRQLLPHIKDLVTDAAMSASSLAEHGDEIIQVTQSPSKVPPASSSSFDTAAFASATSSNGATPGAAATNIAHLVRKTQKRKPQDDSPPQLKKPKSDSAQDLSSSAAAEAANGAAEDVASSTTTTTAVSHVKASQVCFGPIKVSAMRAVMEARIQAAVDSDKENRAMVEDSTKGTGDDDQAAMEGTAANGITGKDTVVAVQEEGDDDTAMDTGEGCEGRVAETC